MTYFAAIKKRNALVLVIFLFKTTHGLKYFV